MKSQNRRHHLFGRRLSGSEASSVMAEIRATADECARRFADTFGTDLDFSEASLTRLEGLLSQMDPPPTDMNLIVADLGCYRQPRVESTKFKRNNRSLGTCCKLSTTTSTPSN
jgi:hypothetical protein